MFRRSLCRLYVLLRALNSDASHAVYTTVSCVEGEPIEGRCSSAHELKRSLNETE